MEAVLWTAAKKHQKLWTVGFPHRCSPLQTLMQLAKEPMRKGVGAASRIGGCWCGCCGGCDGRR